MGNKKSKTKKADKKAAKVAAENAKKMLATKASKDARKASKKAAKSADPIAIADAYEAAVKAKKKPEAAPADPAELAAKHSAETLASVELIERQKAAQAVINDPKSDKKAVKKARRFLVEAAQASADRVADQLGTRPAPSADPADIDRADAEAVKAYNETHGKATGHYITSDDEREKEAARLGELSPEDAERKARIAAKRKAREAYADTEADGGRVDYPDDVPDLEAMADAKHEEREAAHVAEEVETDHGREFAVGPAVEPGSAGLMALTTEPEEAFDVNGLGQYKVKLPEGDKNAGQERGYTRVTTYIDCLEDKGRLTDWKTRLVLLGAALDYEESGAVARAVGSGEPNGTLVREALRLWGEWEKAYRKAAKREKRGELDLGQFGLIRGEADKKLRAELDILTERAMDFAGANEKRERGTNLHAFTERFDRGEFTLADESRLVDAGVATHADFADLRAYDEKMRELGIEHTHIEQRIVVDRLKVAGTLDRASMYRPKGATRRIRVVGDLKTGRVDYSAGKIAMQLGLYAEGEAYDRETGERTKLGLSRKVGLLIHLPAGEATCNVYEVDLALAAKGLKLAADVRAWRNEGKKAYDLKAPLTLAS